MSEDSDVVVIGGGVLGLSIGIAILSMVPKLKVAVVDKEASLGGHASGRNSGVLHAGFYYSPDSLKAKFCRDGNLELRRLCAEHRIPLLEAGKIVVSRNQEEDSRLDLLYERGVANQVPLEILPGSQLPSFEPLAQTYDRFLWSPSTAVANPILVLDALRKDFERMNGKVIFSHEVSIQERSGEITSQHHRARVFVNAAGAQADKVARRVGLAKQYAMVPFMGVYRSIPKELLPIKHLIYPVPHPINPFLGVHFTLTTEGKVKIGPTAIPVLGREQYSLKEGWSLSDIVQSFRATKSLIHGQAHSFKEMIRSESPKVFQRNLIRESASLVPQAVAISGWTPMRPGIRAQLVNTLNGKLEQDFIVETHANSVHVLNSVSPGWTSCLPFGRWIAESKVLPLL